MDWLSLQWILLTSRIKESIRKQKIRSEFQAVLNRGEKLEEICALTGRIRFIGFTSQRLLLDTDLGLKQIFYSAVNSVEYYDVDDNRVMDAFLNPQEVRKVCILGPANLSITGCDPDFFRMVRLLREKV